MSSAGTDPSRGRSQVPRAKLPLVAAVSVAGPSHQPDACEDACSWAVVGGRVVIAMADGLGSVPRGGEGAQTAVTAAMDTAASLLSAKLMLDPDEVAHEMVLAARNMIEQKSEDPRDLACTLIVCVGDEDAMAVAHIGDGAVVGLAHDGPKIISPPGDSEYANEVEHLGQPSWRSALRISVASPVYALAVLTDGVQRAALERERSGYAAFTPFFLPLFDHLSQAEDAGILQQELAAFLSGKRLSEHSDDDKSLALALLTRTLLSPGTS